MGNRFYIGFEKEAGIRDTLSSVMNKGRHILTGQRPKPRIATKPAGAVASREIAPRGSVIRPAPKKVPKKTGPQTLDYSKINADVTAREAARLKRMREGGSTIKYTGRMGSPTVINPA